MKIDSEIYLHTRKLTNINFFFYEIIDEKETCPYKKLPISRILEPFTRLTGINYNYFFIQQ